MTEEPRIPSADDERALGLAAVEHLFVGMTNSAALGESPSASRMSGASSCARSSMYSSGNALEVTCSRHP